MISVRDTDRQRGEAMTGGIARPIGFIGLGTMGGPMALRLARAGAPLLVWNRLLAKSALLAGEGARVAEGAGDVLDACEVTFTMLADGAAIDAVLDRHGPGFAARVSGRTLARVNPSATASRTSRSSRSQSSYG